VLRDSVAVETAVDAAPELVWRLLTVKHSVWWPEMQFDAIAGAPLVETWLEDGLELSASGVITRCDPPDLLAFEWREPSWEHSLEVELRLEETGRSTMVTLTETGFTRARATALADEHEEGWRYHLARLKRACEACSDVGIAAHRCPEEAAPVGPTAVTE
jgi:uncharacterized protein YndB with AHSA1/START domain